MKRNVTQASWESSLKTSSPILGKTRNAKIPPPIAILLMFLLMFLKADIAKGGDFVKNYIFARDRDHMIPLPVADDSSNYVLAGTVGKSSGDISFMKVDGNGTVTFSKVYHEDFVEKTVVDFKENNGRYYIICLVTHTDATARYQLEILEVDNVGAIVHDDFWLPNNISTSIFPIHAMFYNDVLYICGYLCDISSPTTADYTDTYTKQSFIVSFDPNNNNTFLNGQYGETTIMSLGSPVSTGVDYDMGVNMLGDGGDVYLTGSCNVVRPLYSFSYYLNSFQYTSGSLAAHFDAMLNPVGSDVHLMYPAGPDVEYGEHGFSIVKKTISSVDYFYLFGNYYEPTIVAGYQGFVPAPDFYHITALDPSTLQPIYGGANSRWQFAGFDYAWGLQTLPCLSGGDIMMGGMLSNIDPGCYTTPFKPDWDNINPFIIKLGLGINTGTSSIDITTNSARVYLSNYGTGTHTLSNSYYATTDWQYNNTWSANFACQRSVYGVNQNLALTGPVWGSGVNSLLNFKFIQGNSNGNLSVCTDSYVQCMSSDDLTYIESIEDCSQVCPQGMPGSPCEYLLPNWYQLYLSIDYPSTTSSNVSPTVYDCPSDGAIFRPAPAKVAATKATIYPNPANDQINIRLNGSSDNVRVDLTDLLGRVVSNIYNGNSDGLNHPFALPDLSSGLYIVNISLNGKNLPAQKLIINQ